MIPILNNDHLNIIENTFSSKVGLIVVGTEFNFRFLSVDID